MSTVACIGAGTVGRAWAVVFARAGHNVRLYDAIEGEVTRTAIPGARRTLELLSENGLLTEDVETVVARISAAASIAEAVTGVVLVQESVREDVDVKREVFAEIAAHAPADAILASSTSAIPGSDFLGHFAHPERALVVHPVNPPSLIPLVELCGTHWTAPETLSEAWGIMTDAGMRPILLKKEIDGFILNRLQFTLVAEALHLVGEGYCTPEDIDAVLTDGLALRWASIGPFEVAHLNAPDGFQGFVDRLGPMMKRLGAAAQTDYDWTPEQVAAAHAELAERIPIASIADRAAWRDRQILALRQLKQKQ
ncbi:3-hydroxyacyl-CoA dehydrogenase [Devosia lucknowensis]|uniref:3-hydroxyacyl-CoA dehydrogenase n=1 Tax=Devosia lucknowensis TaxID=1096929 RepID=A0A1Y6FQ43_9HYPH|nr:3-hydroxyacyl-CoA dehydrogenase [Devosia lucknowensis]SMQ75611.1 3-hydroxyacyl-CoA dehydrogenase [Devosia lucknowensis]